MNQQIDVGEGPFEHREFRRLDPRTDDLWRRGCERPEWDGVDRGQRKDRAVLVVQLWVVVGMMLFEDAVRLQMTMNDRVNVALLLGFVNVFRRSDWEQPQRGT